MLIKKNNIILLFQSKSFIVCSLFVIMFTCFSFGYWLKYPIIQKILELEHNNQVEIEYQQKKEIEDKVRLIMAMYKSDSLEIFDSIMSTFDPVFVATIIAVESKYKTEAISPAGARGLMQVMPYHFREQDDYRKPSDNIRVGSNLLKDFLKQFNGNKELALAAYNAGAEAVVKAGYKIPVTRNNETINYVLKVRRIDKLIN